MYDKLSNIYDLISFYYFCIFICVVENNNTMYSELQKDKLARHWNKVGILLCRNGSAQVSINGQNFGLSRGMLFVMSPLIQIRDLIPSDDFESVSFADDLKVFYPIFKFISDADIPLRVRKRPCWQLPESEAAYVTVQCKHIEKQRKALNDTEDSSERTLLSRQIHLIEQEVMLEILIDNIRRNEQVANCTFGHELTAYRFILEVHENYRSQRSVAWYAARAKLSPGHFSTIIRHTTGKTPSEWIATITVTYAKFLLEESDKPVKEIAQELNFPEQFTFRKYFKTHAGISPKEYKRQCGKKNLYEKNKTSIIDIL